MKQAKSDNGIFDKMIEIIGDTPYSSEDLKIAGYCLFKKLMAVSIYKPDKMYDGPVTLIKATDNILRMEEVDYGLSKVVFAEKKLFFPFFSSLTNY